jgi:hypothetical protein
MFRVDAGGLFQTAATSAGVPGVKGATLVIGRVGKAGCAQESVILLAKTPAAAASTARLVNILPPWRYDEAWSERLDL